MGKTKTDKGREIDDAFRKEKRFYLTLDDDIVRAPSIGPRTAERLNPCGINCVRDLLNCDAASLAGRLKARHITTARITDQHPARGHLSAIVDVRS